MEGGPSSVHFFALEIPASWCGHGPMLLSTLRLVCLMETLYTKVIGTLHAPQYGIWNSTLGTLHSHETAEVPQKLVLRNIT
jgi:hypothetical protein